MAEVTEVKTTLVTYGTELITAIKKFNITGTRVNNYKIVLSSYQVHKNSQIHFFS